MFVVVAAIVSGTVEVAARRARAAERAAAQAETLSALAGGDLDQSEALKDVLEHARRTFRMDVGGAAGARPRHRLLARGGARRLGAEGQEAPLRFDVPVNPHLRLVGRGPALFAEDRRVLQAFAAAAETAYDARRLNEQAREATALADVDRQSDRAAGRGRARPAHAARRASRRA